MFAQHPGLLCSPSATPVRMRGVGKWLGGDTARQMSQTNQRDVPHHVMSCSATKQRGGGLGRYAMFCSGTGWAPVSLGRWRVIGFISPVLFSFLSFFFHFSFTYQTIFIWTYEVFCFYSSFSPPPSHWGRGGELSVRLCGT